MFAYFVVFTVFLAVILYLVFNHKNIPKLKLSNVSELICLFENNKTLPIGARTRWDLVGVANGLRVWTKKLCCPVSVIPLTVVGSYSQVRISPQILSALLTNSRTQKHWNCYLPKDSVIKTFPLNPTMFDREAMYVEMKKMKIGKMVFESCVRFLNKFLSRQRRINNIRNDLIRCWQWREDGGLWLVEHSVTFSRWLFYLVYPVADEADESLITVITLKSLLPPFKDIITSSSISNVDPTVIIAGLKDFIETKRPLITTPLSISNHTHPSNSTPPTKAETNAIELIKSDMPGQEKEEISIFQKFKNMLEERKDEQNKKTGPPDLSTPTLDLPGPIEMIRRFSMSGRLFEEKKLEGKEKDASPSSPSSPPSSLSLSSSSSPLPSRWEGFARVVNNDSKTIKSLHKTSTTGGERSRLCRHLDSIIDTTAEEIINEKGKVSNLDIKASSEEQASQTGGWIYCGLEKDTVILRKVKSATQPFHSYMCKGLLPCPPKLVFEVLRNPENRMSYDDVIKKVEILDECGSDVKIVRLLYEVGQNFRREKRGVVVVQGERMEGLKHVITLLSVDWPAVKAQYQGNDDDEGGGEDDEGSDGDVGDNLKNSGKYNRYFDDEAEVLDKELNKKIDFEFYKNELSSLSKSVMDEDCVLDKMGASGWIVEPSMKGDNLCAMVTYVCQLSFEESSSMNKSLSQMAVEIALKQPLCVKHLRNYINTMAMIQSRADLKGDSRKSVTLSLSNALAKFRNVEAVQEEENDEMDDD